LLREDRLDRRHTLLHFGTLHFFFRRQRRIVWSALVGILGIAQFPVRLLNFRPVVGQFAQCHSRLVEDSDFESVIVRSEPVKVNLHDHGAAGKVLFAME
jgi:hypothetical protein